MRPLFQDVFGANSDWSRCLLAGLLGLCGGLASVSAVAEAPIVFADETACPADPIGIPEDLLPYVSRDPARLPINLEADQIDIPSPEQLELKGGALATQGARGIYADEIRFDKQTLSLEATNAILYSEDGDRITAAGLVLEMETRIGSARDVTVQFARRDPIPKRKVVDFSNSTFDQSGFTIAAAGALGSLKGPAMTASDVIRLPSGEILKLDFEDSEDNSGSGASSDGETPLVVRAKARATASALFLEGHDRERLQDVVYSRCVAGDDSVVVEASEITLDHASGIGTGEHLKIRFYGVPIAYAPRLSFPITDERKSGLLFPTIGYGQNWGFNLEVPYYWNIAPQRDATFAGRYMASRGLLGSGEYRYMGESAGGNFRGIVRAEYMPDDSEYGSSRYGWSYEHRQNLDIAGSGFSFGADIGEVSDKSYLEDLSDNLQISSASHIPQRVDLSIDPTDLFMEDEDFRINADATAYQTLDSSVSESDEPYSRLPGVKVSWNKAIALNASDSDGYLQDNSTRFSFKPQFASELVNFGHGSAAKTTGIRWDNQLSLAVPMERTYGEITPKLTYAHTSYSVDNQPADQPSDPTRGIYLLEIGSKLLLERDVSWGDENHTQTLVPSLAYHYVPYEDQDDLPVFDSGSVGFDNIADAFLDAGFWGSDRIQNFQGFTLGLSSETYSADSGDDLLSWQFAQQIYLAEREVTLDGAGADSSDFSPLLADATFHVNEDISTTGFANWNWEDSAVGSWRLGGRYSPDFRRELGVSYRWEDTSSNLELDLMWPLAPRWQLGAAALIGQSDDDSNGSYSRVSLGYDACCWALQVALEDRPRDEDEGGVQFLATFSLKSLGRISSDQLATGLTTTAPSWN
ncbi:MAG: LPS-assembly protein LptD [Arenicellales bacterium]